MRKAFQLLHFLHCVPKSALQINQETEKEIVIVTLFLPFFLQYSWYLMSSAFVCGQAFFVFFLLLIEFWFLQQLIIRVWRRGMRCLLYRALGSICSAVTCKEISSLLVLILVFFWFCTNVRMRRRAWRRNGKESGPWHGKRQTNLRQCRKQTAR